MKITWTFTSGVDGDAGKLVERGGGGQLVVQEVAKAASMFGAPASLELIDGSPHAASIVDR